jgi:hypothetical protein
MNEALGTEPGIAPAAADAAEPPAVSRRGGLTRWDLLEAALAVVAFAVMCVVILRTATFMPEPDDHAYQASIIAMTDGHFLSLSTAQARALSHQLGQGGLLGGLARFSGPNQPPLLVQWVQLANGRWISEKDPGYPFLAVVFQELGIIRWAQLFYAALACTGLFAGARRWLGRFGGAAVVGLYCSSGAAMLWGWRDYMPTFTDASLIAAGTGALLWSVLAVEASARRRVIVGLAGFVALEAATFTRYTDIVVLGCAVIAVLVAWRLPAVRLPRSALWWWLGSAVVFLAGVAIFDDLVYGGPLQTGYRPGEIQFSLSAIGPNFRYMPGHLIQAMPEFVLGLAALAWIIVESVRRRGADARSGAARRDLAVGLALAASWFAVWGLYSAYTWTAGPFGTTLQFARFYVPALGAISLLGAWLITRVPRRESLPALSAVVAAAGVVVMFVLGVRAFNDMVANPMGGGLVIKGTQACGRPVSGPHGRVTFGRPSGAKPGKVVCVKARIGPPSRNG